MWRLATVVKRCVGVRPKMGPPASQLPSKVLKMAQLGRSCGWRNSRPTSEKRPRASPRSRQQRRSGFESPEEENAARGGVPRNEASAQLRETLGVTGAGKSRGGSALSQAVAQTHGARGLLRASERALTRAPLICSLPNHN